MPRRVEERRRSRDWPGGQGGGGEELFAHQPKALVPDVVVCAYTHAAARLLGGSTLLHILLSLNTKGQVDLRGRGQFSAFGGAWTPRPPQALWCQACGLRRLRRPVREHRRQAVRQPRAPPAAPGPARHGREPVRQVEHRYRMGEGEAPFDFYHGLYDSEDPRWTMASRASKMCSSCDPDLVFCTRHTKRI